MGNGQELEAIIRHSAKQQKDAGLWLLQTGPRFIHGATTGPNGQAEGRVVGRGGLDFIGDYRGVAVMIEAKATQVATRFDLALIEPHQATIAKKAHERGALAFFLVELAAGSPLNRYFALDWPTLAPWWKGHRINDGAPSWVTKHPESIPLKVFEAECIAVGRERKTLDLIGTIEALQARAVA